MIADDDLQAAAGLIADFVGLRASGATEARLASGIEQRRRARRVDVERYLALLAADGAERQALVDLVTVPETSWFREPAHFEVLIEELVAARHAPVVVWSAGCAGGQEAYSLAIAFAEAGFDDHRIIATDVSQRALAHAEAAVYRGHELRGLSPARRERWFTPVDGGWRLDGRLRNRVQLQRANLLTDAPPVVPGTCEAVFCRNVFIYLRRDRLAACVARFHRALVPAGRLFIGASESLWGIDHGFAVERAGDVFVHRRTDPAMVLPPRPPAPARARARTAARSAVSQAPVSAPNAAAYRQEGEVAARGGRHAVAVAAFRQAACVDPTDPVAHLELGLALEAGGDPQASRRAFQAARRALDRSAPEVVAARLGGWSAEALRAVLDTKLSTPGART